MTNPFRFFKNNLVIAVVAGILILAAVGAGIALVLTDRDDSMAWQGGSSADSRSDIANSPPSLPSSGASAAPDAADDGSPFNTTLDQVADRVYELSYFFGINQFNGTADIPVSALVQFAFSHTYHSSLIHLPKTEKLVYRQAVEETIRRGIEAYFASPAEADLTASDLYNKDKKIFEMWDLQLQGEVNCTYTQKELGDGLTELDVTYFKDREKTAADKSYLVTLQQKDGHYLLVSMKQR